jgi:hypothetical protein
MPPDRQQPRTSAFTLHTNPPRTRVGKAIALRLTINAASEPGNGSAIAQLACVADLP